LLLNEPLIAIENGFNGQNFFLTEGEKEVLCSIKAASLSEYSKMLVGSWN
jgi:hypothetical protein